MKKVIIIGSGIGGLTAGNLLAQKGHHVTIFESNKIPGGYTSGFWRKGFYFESGTLSFESSHMIFKAMKEIGVLDKIEFVRQKSRWVSADFDGTPENYEDFKNIFLTAYPGEKEALNNYFTEVDKMVQAFQPFWSENKKFIDKVIGGFHLYRTYRKYGNQPISEFTAKFFPKDTALNRFFTNIGYPDMAAWILGGAIITLFYDYWTVKNGMQYWADTLADLFKNNGGKLLLNAYVDKILTKDGAAIGVSSNNSNYEADYVISAGDYKKTFLQLLDSPSLIPQPLMEKIHNNAVSEGFFTVYLGLNLPNDQLQSLMKVPHVMYFDDQPGLDIHNSDDEHYFDKTSIVLYSPSMINPSLAPGNKSTLMLQAMAPYHWLNNWGVGDRQQYRRLKEKAKNAIIKKASVIIPHLKEVIEFEDAATPLTYERYTHNTDGATSAWSWNPANKFHKKFTGVYVESPVKNLLVGSCWANQIGGVPGAIGAAYKCVKKIGK